MTDERDIMADPKGFRDSQDNVKSNPEEGINMGQMRTLPDPSNEEGRRLFALEAAIDTVKTSGVSPNYIVPIAADIERYLLTGQAPVDLTRSDAGWQSQPSQDAPQGSPDGLDPSPGAPDHHPV